MSDIYSEIERIVGGNNVSRSSEEKYLYSRDQGLQRPHDPDCVVLPGTVQDVQEILRLANREKMPVVPMGGGLVLSGLSIPQRGGIVMDMKRMNRVLEVNEACRYAVVEAGTGTGMLKAYLERHHPSLKSSMPDAPPIATIAGNVAIHGSGHLSQSEGGFHSEMVTGLEVVLPTGELVRLGSCSTVPGWFSRAPLPDLAGLFLGWNGTTGIITKVGIKLYPKPAMSDVVAFMTEDLDTLPDVIGRITGTEMAEDVAMMIAPKPDMFRGFQLTAATVTANSKDEMKMRIAVIRESLREYYERKEAGFAPIPPAMKEKLSEQPQKTLTGFADVLKGGGFEYVGGIIPTDKIPGAARSGLEIAERMGITYSLGARVIGRAHCVMFFFAYPFNRADQRSMEQAGSALEQANMAILSLGGIPWKAEVPAQELILERMDPATKNLMVKIKNTLDPNGIMNPGNWEVK